MKNNLNKKDLFDAQEIAAFLKGLNPEERSAVLYMIYGYGLAKGADMDPCKPGKSA